MSLIKTLIILLMSAGFSQSLFADESIAQKPLRERQKLALQAAFSHQNIKVEHLELYDDNGPMDDIFIGGYLIAREALAIVGNQQSRDGYFRVAMLAYNENEITANNCSARVYFKSGTNHIEFLDLRYCQAVMNPKISATIRAGQMFGSDIPKGLVVLERNCNILKADSKGMGENGENCLVTKAILGNSSDIAPSSWEFSLENKELYLNDLGQAALR